MQLVSPTPNVEKRCSQGSLRLGCKGLSDWPFRGNLSVPKFVTESVRGTESVRSRMPFQNLSVPVLVPKPPK